MLQTILFLIVIVFTFYKIIWPILSEVLWPSKEEENITTISEEDNTVHTEDFILHDMVNENDTYDIGVINFND